MNRATQAGMIALILAAGYSPADTRAGAANDQTPQVVDVRRAYQYALANNPELAVARQQRGIASAGLVQARTYPFNPYLTLGPRGVVGGFDEGVLRHFTIAGSVTLELEVFHQRAKRIEAARANLSKTEWDIAAQELSVAVRAVRAFNTAIYRKEKLELLQAYLGLSEQALRELKELWKKKKEKEPAGEVVLAQFEVQEAKAQVISGRVPWVTAQQELMKAIGAVHFVTTQGSLEITYRDWREDELVKTALTARADIQARRMAVVEAEARLKLERSNRFGNLTVGPNYEINEAKAQFIGASVAMPLAVYNRKKGEVLQRDAELAKSVLEQQQLEFQTRQEVKSALARLAEVQELIRVYRKDYLPALEARGKELQKLYAEGGEGVDLQQVLELRRRLLKTRESYLDALYDHGQFELDLAAAVGVLELAFDP